MGLSLTDGSDTCDCRPEPEPSSSSEEDEPEEYDGDVEIKPRGKRQAVLCLVSGFACFLIMVGTMSLMVGEMTHARNNYANETSLPGAPGGKSVDNPTGDAYLLRSRFST
jgi:hypothetical protein